MFSNDQSFSIHVVGERTGNVYAGDFVALKFLPARLILKKDQLLRNYLAGDNPLISGAVDLASKLAVVQTALKEMPDFWKSSNGGMEILDPNVIEAVYVEVDRIQRDAESGLKKAAAETISEVQKAAEQPPST